jgi:hypothetical protein
VAQIKGGNLDLDYTAFRYAYAASPNYDPYDFNVANQRNAIRSSYNAGDCDAAMAAANEILKVNFVQIDAHFVTGLCQKKAGNEEGARVGRTVADRLLKSVLTSGDGKTPQTAFVVIAIDEEYKVLGILGLVPGRQLLVKVDGADFDRLEAKAKNTGETVTLYFNIDHLTKNGSQAVK